MRPDEKSIETLAMRMRHQVNPALEKELVNQNIQYYVSSTRLQREGVWQDFEKDVKASAEEKLSMISERSLKEEEKPRIVEQTQKEETLSLMQERIRNEENASPFPRQIAKAGEPPMMEYEKIPEPSETEGAQQMQQIRGKSEYDKVRHSQEYGDIPGNDGFYYLNEKG